MTRPRPGVVYVVPDKMGGMMNIIANLLARRRPDAFEHQVVLTHNHLHTDERHAERLAADVQTTVEYTLPTENLHAVMRRVARAVPAGGGVYVAGDLLDLATASVHDFGRAVIYMLHGDSEYYYDLAVKHEPVVHAFIAYSRKMYDELVARLPHRRDTIFHLPYGIDIPEASRRRADGPLRLVYAGRFEQRQKGIFDLPEIDRALHARGVRVTWTAAGAGPDENELRQRWAFNDRVRWLGRLTPAQLMTEYVDQDVFVLPTRQEGFPVALLEAMSAGVVPVVSDIDSGVPEVVADDRTGMRARVGDIGAFADAIARLDRERGQLDAMSALARGDVAARFDVRDRVAAYQALYSRWEVLYRPSAGPEHLRYGSRLDRSWIPNPIVRLVRTALATSKS
jgi:glycosyltransferase involved in cell wall biosynthesis